MKRSKRAMAILFLMGSLLITTGGCQTTDEVVAYPTILPPKPERETLSPPPDAWAETPISVKNWITETLVYYKAFMQKWEYWSEMVRKSD